jgi:hypothetical protein
MVLNSGDPATYLTGTAYRSLIVNSTGAVAEVAHGTSGKVWTSQGASADPTWETPSAGTHALDAGQTDVTITTPADDEVLSYESGIWINKTAAEAGLASIPLPSNCVGATAIDETATDIAFKQIILTPTASGTGTTEGTLFFDSDDNHLYVYVT